MKLVMLYLFSDHHHHHLYWIVKERSKQHEEIKKLVKSMLVRAKYTT